ncbi:unnamed protein product, partial [Protopolystoma xenopodis]
MSNIDHRKPIVGATTQSQMSRNLSSGPNSITASNTGSRQIGRSQPEVQNSGGMTPSKYSQRIGLKRQPNSFNFTPEQIPAASGPSALSMQGCRQRSGQSNCIVNNTCTSASFGSPKQSREASRVSRTISSTTSATVAGQRSSIQAVGQRRGPPAVVQVNDSDELDEFDFFCRLANAHSTRSQVNLAGMQRSANNMSTERAGEVASPDLEDNAISSNVQHQQQRPQQEVPTSRARRSLAVRNMRSHSLRSASPPEQKQNLDLFGQYSPSGTGFLVQEGSNQLGLANERRRISLRQGTFNDSTTLNQPTAINNYAP